MKVKIEHSGWIEKGNLKLSNKKRFEQEIKSFPDSDVKVIVKKAGKASSQSRRYYFGIVVPEFTAFLRELGNDVDEETVHEWLKLKCNKSYLKDGDGVVIGEVGGSTTEHNQDERGEFIERCIMLASELGLSISPPNTQTDIKFD